jgi:uncharacterized protein (UPF0212 family)
MQKALIKWVPVGIGACFAIGFLINSQWILAAIVAVVTVLWLTVLNQRSDSAKKLAQLKVPPRFVKLDVQVFKLQPDA